MNFALLGMPNCGKSTLFHLLTGVRVPTGNRPGVTVTATSAPLCICKKAVTLWDLPGIRTVPTTSADEAETLRFLVNSPPDLLLVVLDATTLFSSLPLLSSLLAGLPSLPPLLLVFNCCDELSVFPNSHSLTALTNLPSVALSARTGKGLSELETLLRSFSAVSAKSDFSQKTAFFRDPSAQNRLILKIGGTSRKKERFSSFLDRLFLHPFIGIPLFLFLMLFALFLTFGSLGNFLSDLFCTLALSPLAFLLSLVTKSIPPWLSSLLSEGVLNGVGAVLSFLPRMGLLFFFQALLEQSGVLARVSRLFDPFFRRFGLRGDAVTPLLLGFGCSVPAILCTRSMKDADAADRCASCLPAVACSARMPLCLLISETFFPTLSWLVCAGVWIFSGLVFLLLCAILARISGTPAPTRHEDPLPRWRVPAFADLFGSTLSELLRFLSRAGGTIFLCSLSVWFLSHFRFGVGEMVPISESTLSLFASIFSPLLVPLGFGDWRISASLLCGIGAKEASLSTLGILLGSDAKGLPAVLLSSGCLTRASAVSFLVFYTLYFPCLATVSTLRGEKKRLRRLVLPLLFAWIFAFFAYRIAKILL